MTVTSYIFGIVSAVLVLVVVIELLRRRSLRERHAVWWLFAGILALIVGIFPVTLGWAASLIGIEVPLNLVLFVSIAILFFVALQHSSELTKLESKTRTLAERVAIMELELRQLREASAAKAPSAVEPAVAEGSAVEATETTAVEPVEAPQNER